MKVAVILPAAGLGTRMGKGTAEKAGTSRKQFMLLDGSPILMHTVRKFIASDRVGVIVIAVRAEDTEWVREMLAEEFESGRVRVVEGGNSRQESVEHALGSLGPEYELVAVHDAVRPFIDLETIRRRRRYSATIFWCAPSNRPGWTASSALTKAAWWSAWMWRSA